MNQEQTMTFDRIGLYFIQRYWWDEEIVQRLGPFLAHFLAPKPGRAWFRTGGGEWISASEDNLERLEQALRQEIADWQVDAVGDFADCRRLSTDHRWALFMDADRFRASVDEGDDIPGDYFVGFEADWRWNNLADTVFTPHFRVTNCWPESLNWAPPSQASADDCPRLSVAEAASTLWTDYWVKIEDQFRATRGQAGIAPAHIDLDRGPQQPSVFFYLSPCERMSRAEAYLQGDLIQPMDRLANSLLRSPDIRSMEITGGVMEGCMAVFNHRPSFEEEFNLLIPLPGHDEADIENTLTFITGHWQEIDFDATWEIYDTNWKGRANEAFFKLWFSSLSSVVTMSESLFSLLGKEAIQERMFSLSHLLTGFLAKLQVRTFAAARERSLARRALDRAIRDSKNLAERRFTVRAVPGLDLMRNISDGYSRAFEEFDERISKEVGEAETLTTEIESIGKLLSHTAGLEEQKRGRARERALEREEKTGKLLNRVLALVAVLAAIPLLVGEFPTESLASGLQWLGFGADFSVLFTRVGLHFSFWTALLAFGLTIWALSRTIRQDDGDGEDLDGPVATVEALSQSLFDGYRGFEHADVVAATQAVGQAVRAGGRFWADGDENLQAARTRIHQLDLELAGVTAEALKQSHAWSAGSGTPADDEAWAESMEKQVCRFVLLSDVFDLRPKLLRLPVTLGLHRFCRHLGGLQSSPVSDHEFELIMTSFGYTDEERQHIDDWASAPERIELTAAEFLEAYNARGVNALHKAEIS